MCKKCQMVVFSNKAYNAIIRESFDKDPVETGGILLGHILDNGVWIVMEVLPPGIKCIFKRAYFEYDDTFVNYLAQKVANQYKIPLDLLGLWHRHPGSMDVFSSTDDGTNMTFAAQNPRGAISGLVNIDPRFRLTMYHLDNPGNKGCRGDLDYNRVDVEVGDDIIPEEYLRLRYYNGEGDNLNPMVERIPSHLSCSVKTEGVGRRVVEEKQNLDGEDGSLPDRGSAKMADEEGGASKPKISPLKRRKKRFKKNRKKVLSFLILGVLMIMFIFSIKKVIEGGRSIVDAIESKISGETTQSCTSDVEDRDSTFLEETMTDTGTVERDTAVLVE